MSIRIVRLGSPRAPDEGLRIGTVRRPQPIENLKKWMHADMLPLGSGVRRALVVTQSI